MLSMPSQDYEDGKSPEAVVVKDLDKFDMIFQAFAYEKGITNYLCSEWSCVKYKL